MADLGNLHFQIHLKDYTDAEADKIKKKLENLSVKLTIDGKNVNVSHTDLIKKQIEDAIKSVSVQSVKVDTNAVKNQINTALQGITPQVSISLLKGNLSNDLQAYLNTKTFNVSISITQSSVQNAVRTAFSSVSVPVSVTVKASAVAQQIQQSISNAKVKVGIEPKDPSAFVKDIENKINSRKVKVDIEPNHQHLVQSVKQALQGVQIKSQVKVDVDAQAITNAVQSAINNAKFTYSPNGGRSSGGSGQRNNTNNWSQRASHGLYESARASVSLGRSLSTNIRIAGELGTALGNIASIFRIKDILSGVVQIGGQLENQRIALGAILQDGGKATEMFGKIQSLAVKSPFGVMDLNQYTKQLSAYGFEYNELYDTMKRMADISAGVGVDMGRIILAFGQVKAAGFLKGTELRQFTEANIPMVEKLAEKFSLLEKRIVSAGEVYDMISEKKVTFQDVKDVLWGLTDEGGMFNNMQEVLSESLASKWKNLSDAIDVMYGKIADGMIGNGLKALAEGLTELTKNWQTLIGVIGAAGAAYASYKISVAIGSGNEAMGVYKQILANKKLEVSNLRVAQSYRNLGIWEKAKLATSGKISAADLRQAVSAGVLTKEYALRLLAMKKIKKEQVELIANSLKITQAEIAKAAAVTRGTLAWNVLKNALIGVGNALKVLFANPWTWVFAGISAISTLWTSYRKTQDEIEERTKAATDSARGSIESLNKEFSNLQGFDASKLNNDEVRTKIEDITTLIKNESSNWKVLLNGIFAKNADGTFVYSAREQLDLLIQKMESVKQAKEMMLNNPSAFGDSVAATGSSINPFNEDVVENFKDYESAYIKSEKILNKLGDSYGAVSKAIKQAATSNKELQSRLNDNQSIQEQIKIVYQYANAFERFRYILGKKDVKAAFTVGDWVGEIKGLKTAWGNETKFAKDLDTFVNNIWTGLSSEGYSRDGILDESAQQVVYEYGNKLVEAAGVTNPKIQKDFWKKFLPRFGMEYKELDDFSVVPKGSFDNEEPQYDPSKDKVAKMWKKRSEEIDKAVKMYDQWKKLEGADKARTRVQTKDELANLFSGAYGFNLDLESPTAAYEHIQSKLNKNLSAQKELLIQLGVKISDAELKYAQDKLKQFVERTKTELKRTADQWDLYKQLFEATGNKDFSMTAFKVTPVWDEAANKMYESFEKAVEQQGFGGVISFGISESLAKEQFGELFDSWKLIKDRIEKNGIDLKVNIADIYKSSKDFDIRIDTINKELHDKLQKLSKSGLSQDAIGTLTQDLMEQAEQAISEIEFEKFKKSVDYVRFFSNLENQGVHSILAMRDAMLKFGKSANLSTEELDALVKDVERLEKTIVDKKPFKAIELSVGNLSALREAYKAANDAYKKNPTEENLKQKEQAKGSLDAEQQKLDAAFKNIYDHFGKFANAIGEVSSMLEKFGNKSLTNFANFLDSTSSGMQSGYNVGSLFGGAGGVIGGFVGAATGAMAGLAEAGRKAVEAEQERSQVVIDRLEKVSSILKDKIANSLTGLYNSTLDATTKMEMKLQKEKYDEAENYYKRKNINVDDGKWRATTFDNTSFSWDTNDFLVYSKKTHEAINKALESDNEYMAAYASMLAQRDELMYQEASYSDKDDEKVENYKRDKKLEIEKLTMEIKQLSEDMMSSLYTIDFQSWSEQLTNSIVDAWSKGEDAAKAYEDTVSDILRNVATSMVQQKIIGDYFSEYLDPFVDSFIDNNGLMTDEMFLELGNILSGGLDRIDKAEKFLDDYEKALNEKDLSMKEQTESSSSLSKGIQGITEDTANLLASYANSIRADVSVKRTLIEQLVNIDVPQMSIIAQAQLQQLQQVVANTKRNADAADSIKEALGSVIGIGKSGKAIKIV